MSAMTLLELSEAQGTNALPHYLTTPLAYGKTVGDLQQGGIIRARGRVLSEGNAEDK